ncbi:outer membrane beta-barrel protein [Gaetbulibacter saemankumensis]|uniref:outer membrane beta-barrel protein n=1 Tax=Gaetbulibacter saemankumensis TaxID=311208 RepID=UPI00040E2063|nr:outer membrane beta-barrel protein [Gaetbulibacter saemankumensis]
MKNLFLLCAAFLISATIYAQSSNGFGFKFGVNYNANGDYFESIEMNAKSPKRNVGYNLGFFYKTGEQVYFKPELLFTRTKADYDNDSFVMKKLDMPLLVGVKVVGPLNVFAGPALQYILDTEFDGITLNDVEKDFTVGLNFGIGFSLNKLGIDLRYERGFTENEVTFINSNIISTESRIDTRPDQLILSLSLIL